MHRFYLAPEKWDDQPVRLSRDESHHLAHVLRLESEAMIVVFDGKGREADAWILETGGGGALVEIREQRHIPHPALTLTLFQALPKGKRMDVIVEKATELGVSRIVPMVTDCAVSRPDSRRGEKKAARWERIARGAARQCGAVWVPEVTVPVTFASVMGREAANLDCTFLAALDSGSMPLHEAVARSRAQGFKNVGLLIGPEGDFSAAEIAAARDAGCRVVSLGALTLRVETAALYGLSVLGYELFRDAGGTS